MESWRKVWREGFAPQFSTESLEMLRLALETGDSRLLRNGTATIPEEAWQTPDPRGAEVLQACPVAWTGWQGEGLRSLRQVDWYFATACKRADEAMGEPAACAYFTAAWDEGEVSSGQLLEEVVRTLRQRGGELAATG